MRGLVSNIREGWVYFNIVNIVYVYILDYIMYSNYYFIIVGLEKEIVGCYVILYVYLVIFYVFEIYCWYMYVYIGM